MRKMQSRVRNEAQFAAEKVKVARYNLLLMIIFTVINIAILLTDGGVMLLFSATVPYFAVLLASMAEITAVGIGVALFILVLYFICWIFSKKHYGWMIAALVLFAIDTLLMAVSYILIADATGILDVVIHIWVFYYLIIGVKYGIKLKKLPIESLDALYDEDSENCEEAEEAFKAEEFSEPIRRADTEVKHRVLLESNVAGHNVCYRRVKRVNELVIDGYVYAEIKMLVETAHTLSAVIGGHQIEAGFDGGCNSFIMLDGDVVAKKFRIY